MRKYGRIEASHTDDLGRRSVVRIFQLFIRNKLQNADKRRGLIIIIAILYYHTAIKSMSQK